MATGDYVELRRRVIANPTGTGAPFVATTDWFNKVARNTYSTQEDSAVNDPRELATGAEVFSYEYRPGKVRFVYYNGNGSVYTANATGGSSGPSSIAVLQQHGIYTSVAGAADESVDVTGRGGVPPYALKVEGVSGAAVGYSQTGSSLSESYFFRFYNLPTGDFLTTITDAAGGVATRPFTVQAGHGTGDGLVLSDTYSGDSTTGTGTQLIWLFNSHEIVQVTYTGGGNDGDTYQVPVGALIDSYLLPDGVTLRQWYVDDAALGPPTGGVYYVDSSTAKQGLLTLHNLILFHPDTPGGFGAAIVEVDATALPVTFSLPGHGSNQTGRFDELPAGPYEVLATDATGATLRVPFELKVKYGKRWVLDYNDLDSTPLRLELWVKGYTGAVEDIDCDAAPVVLKSDGLSTALGGQGDVPSSVGTSADLRFLIEPDLFEPIVTDVSADRYCRADVYYNNQLEFRGYVQPDTYDAYLLQGKQVVSITATDGLAALKDAYMLGHIGQRLAGHRPVLHTLLHCLSRCEIALPLRIYTNRRDSAMSDADAPELATTTNRTGYYDSEKNEPIYQRTVLDALVQLLGGTLVQRGGVWEVRSLLEAAKPAAGRAYKTGGTALPAVVAPAPAGAIRPPGRERWHWLKGTQGKQVRPGWKSLAGTADAGWLKNAFPAGDVFSDKYAWLTDFSKLQPINGWHAAAGKSFPLVLVRGGAKGTDYSTQWLRSTLFNMEDTNYLESPPLPLVPRPESTPAFLSFTATLAASEFYTNYSGLPAPSPTTGDKAFLPYEILLDGRSVGGLKTVEVKPASGSNSDSATTTIPLDVLPAGTQSAVLRVYAWYALDTQLFSLAPEFVLGQAYEEGSVVKVSSGPAMGLYYCNHSYGSGLLVAPGQPYDLTWSKINSTDRATGKVLVSNIGVQLRPQNTTWEGTDNFRADAPAGSVRPTEPLATYHPDIPLAAGLFSGNLYAFGKAAGLADGTQSTSWKRDIDAGAAPLLESNTYDALALRANPSRLLRGVIRHNRIAPPRMLDSIDTPFDVPGRRFIVAAVMGWNMKECETEVALVEIGRGADAADPLNDMPDGVRITHQLYQFLPGRYTPYVRLTHGSGVRIRH